MLPPKYAFVRQTVVELWAGEPDSVTLVRESANVVCRFEVKGNGRFLRITNIWQRKKVVSAIDYLRFLYGRGAPMCAPIASVNGRYIEDCAHNNSIYMCRACAEAPGEVLGNRCTEPKARGKAIARLHQVVSRYQPHPDLYFWSHDQEVQETIEFLPSDDVLA